MGSDINNMEGSMGSKSSNSRSRARAKVASATLALGAMATVVALGPGAAVASARTLNLNDTAGLHLNNKHGVVLKESGNAKGSLAGSLFLQLEVTSTRSVVATVQVYPSGGSITGSASASYHVNGATASFTGHMNITKGSGKYSKAKGSGLTFSGTIQRSNDAVTVHVSGKMSY